MVKENIGEAGKQQEHQQQQQPHPTYCAGLREMRIFSGFPLWLQNVIINAILDSACERATDIWCEDEATGTVHVMRANMQWHLNETASQLWLELGGKRVGDIIDRMCDSYQNADRNDIRFCCIEFLLMAYENGLVTFPEPGK